MIVFDGLQGNLYSTDYSVRVFLMELTRLFLKIAPFSVVCARAARLTESCVLTPHD